MYPNIYLVYFTLEPPQYLEAASTAASRADFRLFLEMRFTTEARTCSGVHTGMLSASEMNCLAGLELVGGGLELVDCWP